MLKCSKDTKNYMCFWNIQFWATCIIKYYTLDPVKLFEISYLAILLETLYFVKIIRKGKFSNSINVMYFQILNVMFFIPTHYVTPLLRRDVIIIIPLRIAFTFYVVCLKITANYGNYPVTLWHVRTHCKPKTISDIIAYAYIMLLMDVFG